MVKFKTLEDAINYCKIMGLGFELEYPKFRYHARKNYGDNFKWKGNPKPELEDI
jgi:ETC complex I subunit conserved region.